jgi:hypothetical protein
MREREKKRQHENSTTLNSLYLFVISVVVFVVGPCLLHIPVIQYWARHLLSRPSPLRISVLASSGTKRPYDSTKSRGVHIESAIPPIPTYFLGPNIVSDQRHSTPTDIARVVHNVLYVMFARVARISTD